jgi:hypothetical protein
MNSKFCTCTYQLTEINVYGERVCAHCGKPFGHRVTIDRPLLVQMARLVADMRMADMMTDGYTVDEARTLRTACEQILREHDADV